MLAAPPAPNLAAFDDDAWEDLLNYIEEKRVIPIVGPELCTIQTDAVNPAHFTYRHLRRPLHGFD